MEKVTKDIGQISGTLFVFGGVYSNLEALTALKHELESQKVNPSNIICTGDIVAYCADPEACIQLIKNWGIHVIAGNVELQIRNGERNCGCNFEEGTTCDLLSAQWYPYALNQVSNQSVDWLKSLPDFIQLQLNSKKGLVIHGGFEETSQFIFKSTDVLVKHAILDQTKSDFIIAGHCGIPFYEQCANGSWYNAGVIGMPANDGSTSTWYMQIADSEELTPTYHQLCYEHEVAAVKMNQKHLPNEYAQTLLNGIWDNCDVLPQKETRQQGKPLNL